MGEKEVQFIPRQNSSPAVNLQYQISYVFPKSQYVEHKIGEKNLIPKGKNQKKGDAGSQVVIQPLTVRVFMKSEGQE